MADAQPASYAPQGNGGTAAHLATHWKKYTVGALVAAVVILIIVVAWFMKNDNTDTFYGGWPAASAGPSSNLVNGGNNPMWYYQRGDAGWGGPMQSTYQTGQSRVWGASAEGPDEPSVIPYPYQSCAAQSAFAGAEAQLLGALSDESLSQQIY
jgi:hypothetical protein